MLTGYVWMGIDFLWVICCVYHLVFLFSLVRYYVVSNFVRLLQFLLGNAVWLYSSFDCVVCARIAITYLVVEISGLSYNGAK
jgi:hypothetical protein